MSILVRTEKNDAAIWLVYIFEVFNINSQTIMCEKILQIFFSNSFILNSLVRPPRLLINNFFK